MTLNLSTEDEFRILQISLRPNGKDTLTSMWEKTLVSGILQDVHECSKSMRLDDPGRQAFLELLYVLCRKRASVLAEGVDRIRPDEQRLIGQLRKVLQNGLDASDI